MKPLSEWSDRFFEMLDMTDYPKNTAESDKLCFRNAMKQFLASGRKEDAFSVYFCFSEFFQLFGHGYENTKKLLETLSDHEYHSGELLSKHRDHYSHSVYVFALGLAIFAGDPAYRNNYLSFYGLADERRSALNFLKYWGMVALFHDIGYPFQLAHEQIKTYAEDVWGKGAEFNPYVSYGNFDKFIKLDKRVRKNITAALPEGAPFSTYHDLLAYGLEVREGYERGAVCEVLKHRATKQPNFMDHGYFSALILARQLFSLPEYPFDMQCLDVLTAILLHNSFNKFDAPQRHPIRFGEHPLAYLIILCDELQCWDRLAYGKISKRDPIAWDFSMNVGENVLTVCYTYDSYVVRTYDDDLQPDVGFNKNYREMKEGKFLNKLLGYVSSPMRITVRTQEAKKQKKTSLYASDDNFIGLCDLAKAIHASYNDHCASLNNDYISRTFGELPLEFKLSNIEQAKSYGYKLELINCFFSRKELDYPVVEDFDSVEADYKSNLGFLCREEHVRWVKEKLANHWRYGTDYTAADRNIKKMNKCIVPYELLSKEEQSKDELFVKNILVLLKKFDSNIKIYNFRMGRKPNLEIAGTGHRYFNDDPEVLKARVKEVLEKYSKTNRVIVRTCFAYGADQLIAECAVELGLTLKAVLPMPVEEYIANVREDAIAHGRKFEKDDEELTMRHLLAQTVVCKTVADPKYTYAEANKYILDKCDVLIALWDGKEMPLEDYAGRPINRGGTYDCIKMAEKLKKKVIPIDCYR